MILFFVMNLITGMSAFLLAYRFFQFDTLEDSLIAVFLLYFSQIVYTELVTGVAGRLYLPNLLLFNFVILMVVWRVTCRRKFVFPLQGIEEKTAALFKDKAVLIVAAILLGFGLVKVFVNLVNPPFGWDSLNYHFTFPVEWLKHGNLLNPITIADDPSPSYYPINGSLFFLWLILPLKSAFLADLGQLPFFLAAFLAVYSLGRKISLNERNAFLAAGLFALIPNYFKQLQVAYVDVMAAALFLAALNYLFLLKEDFSFKHLLFFSLAAGLLLGTKTTALPYTALLIIPFLYLGIRKIKTVFPLLVLAFLLILLFGGFTYLRNLIDTGNPLYPLDFKLFGQQIFHGVMDKATYSARFAVKDYSLAKILFHEGLGAQTILFVFPFMFLALPLALFRRKNNPSVIASEAKQSNAMLVYLLILPWLIYLVYRFIIPMGNLRYIYNLLAIGILLGFYTLAAKHVPERVIAILSAICALVSASELAKKQELAAGLVFSAALFFLLPLIIRKPKYILLLLACGVSLLPFAEEYHRKNEYPRYAKMVKYSGFWPEATKAWDWLNQRTFGANIAYTGRPVPFPLYGTGLKNNVYYASVNFTQPARLEYYPHSRYRWGKDAESMHENFADPGNYRSDANYAFWLKNLKARRTDYLFIYALHHTRETIFPIEDFWAKSDPGRFHPEFANQIVHIYKVVK